MFKEIWYKLLLIIRYLAFVENQDQINIVDLLGFEDFHDLCVIFQISIKQ